MHYGERKSRIVCGRGHKSFEVTRGQKLKLCKHDIAREEAQTNPLLDIF